MTLKQFASCCFKAGEKLALAAYRIEGQPLMPLKIRVMLLIAVCALAATIAYETVRGMQ